MRSQYGILDSSFDTARPSGCCALAVMAKAPRLGAVKTRLVPPLRPDEAAELSRCFLRDVTAVIGQVCVPGQVDGFAAYTPFGQEAWFDGLLPEGFRLLVQRGADLGERLLHAAGDFFAAGYQSMCLINSDSPTLPVAVLIEAVDALRQSGDRMVIGPAEDGGYYLIGLKRAHHRLFEEIAWSTDTVLGSTLDRAQQIGLETVLLPSWYDVDDAAALGRLCHELFPPNGRGGTQTGYAAPHTRDYLRQLIRADEDSRLGLELSAEAG
jgi:rSAM/selenodomain-associated transferase 1